VTTESEVLRSTLVIVTVAPGTIAPDESVMMPPMLPYTACALALTGANKRSTARRRSEYRTRKRDTVNELVI